MHRHTHIVTLASLLTACQLDPKDIGTPDSASEATTSSSGADTSAGSVTQGSATEATDTGLDPITSTGATDTVASSEPEGTDTSDTAGTDTAPETAGEDTGDLPPRECDAADPTVDATFALDVPGWPVDPQTPGLKYDVLCTVDAVDAANPVFTTTLTCDVEGTPLPATLDLASAPEGAAVWKPGDGVRLVYRDVEDPLDEAKIRALELRRGDDDALLVSANDSVIDDAFQSRFAPLTVDLVFACGAPDGPVPQRVDFTPPGGDTLSIFDGHRGLLPISADEGFAIDVALARADEFHFEGDLKVLLRRVDLTP